MEFYSQETIVRLDSTVTSLYTTPIFDASRAQYGSLFVTRNIISGSSVNTALKDYRSNDGINFFQSTSTTVATSAVVSYSPLQNHYYKAIVEPVGTFVADFYFGFYAKGKLIVSERKVFPVDIDATLGPVTKVFTYVISKIWNAHAIFSCGSTTKAGTMVVSRSNDGVIWFSGTPITISTANTFYTSNVAETSFKFHRVIITLTSGTVSGTLHNAYKGLK